jgi:signal transduction histidine kinase
MTGSFESWMNGFGVVNAGLDRALTVTPSTTTGRAVSSRNPLENFIADELRRHSNDLANEWIDDIERADRAASAKGALVAELREHVPDLVRSIVEFMRDPGDPSRSAVIARLRLHADRRRAQGYDIHQLLTDFELLSKLVFAAFSEAVGRSETVADVRAVADLAGRLREALMEITSDAVGMYREAELEQRRALAKKVADFTRSMTHELKNPLGAARSGTEMLQDADIVKTSDDRDRFLRLVLRNLVRMQDLIQDIRALAMADDSERGERWTRLDTLVAKVFDELRPSAKTKDVRLEVEGTLPDATVDAARLEIALINLVGNSIKYSDSQKQDRRVTVSARESGDELKKLVWRIEIRDNGLGIPRELHGSVFKQHFRAHPNVAEGTGLGLTIASELIAGAGGRIWFESEEHRGTTFFIEIPDGADRRTGERRSAETSSSLRQ